ncbi:MAG: HAD-IIIC family phosphatase [Elainellaceae cyanobacterium]
MREFLHWLPKHSDFREAIAICKQISESKEQIRCLREIAKHNLDFTQTSRVDRRLQEVLAAHPGEASGLQTIRLAVLASSTIEHLLPAIRVAALRRGLIAECYVAPYGQYRQEVLNPASGLYEFQPDVVLLALNGNDVGVKLPWASPVQDVKAAVEQRVDEWVHLWETINTQLKAIAIQQMMVIPPEHLFGHYDAVLPASPASILNQVNEVLRSRASEHKVLLLNTDEIAAYIGKHLWCDAALWHHAKQDISPVYSPLYGDHLARMLAAVRGLSYKCLVLDLDNTVWGGVIGDDGLSGILLGQGNAVGEAFYAFQAYAKALKERGIILAVCSKNEEANALEPFEKHPEMILRQDDIAVFVANWEDKATNLKRIATTLNIGLDSLVFFDDNPVERAVVRQFAPAVAVPEVPEDPALYVRCLSDAGYFEAVSFSGDDMKRAEQYLANSRRNELKEKAHSLEGFLESLHMEMSVASVDSVSLPRATQLINKSNQFNLTTHRYTEAQVKQMSEDPDVLCLQVRLKDDFGDNGLISVAIAKPIIFESEKALHIDTWLMSCRVLGRQVEQEVLNVLVNQARYRRYRVLYGEYIQTAKNGMVKDHYAKLGFELIHEKQEDGEAFRSLWKLDLDQFKGFNTFIKTTVSV